MVRATTPSATSGPTATGRRTTGSPRSAARPGRATRAPGRWYLHSFYPEQPDLDWRRADVREAVGGALRFWLRARRRRLSPRRDRPPAQGPAAARRPARRRPAGAARARRRRHARARPQPQRARHRPGAGGAARGRRRRHAARRRGLPAGARSWRPYLEHLDCAFAFELLHAPWEAAAFRAAIEAALDPAGRRRARSPGCSPTTTSRACPTAYGARNARAAALLALTLPGRRLRLPGRRDRHGGRPGRRPAARPRRPRRPPPPDALGRRRAARRLHDARRREPWLPAIAVDGGGVAQQAGDPDSVLAPVPRPHRRARRARRRPRRSSRTSPTACSPSAAGPTTSSR